MNTLLRTFAFGTLILAAHEARSAEQYILEAPGNPPVRSTAIISSRGLTIVDENGRRNDYVAYPAADSRDRRYLGYYSSAARQYVQWPIAGTGPLYIGTPDGVDVQWTQSRMRVYPVGRDPGVVRPGTIIPGGSLRPPLVDAVNDQAIVPNPPLAPVTVEFVNRHTEPLLARLVDLRDSKRATEFRIAPREAVAQRIDRDSGATAREAFTTRGPFGEIVQQYRSLPIPPKSLYEVNVYAERVTSVTRFLPDKNKPRPPEVTKSPVSLGVFALPAGTRLREGDRIDVYAEAISQQNPGAAR